MANIILNISLSRAIAVGDKIVINVCDENVVRIDGDVEALSATLSSPQTGDCHLPTEQHVSQSFFLFMDDLIKKFKASGNLRTSETYSSARSSFSKFREGMDIDIREINRSVIGDYDEWLRHRNVTPNTVSFYMRILRAAYNRAVDQRLTSDRQPFSHVYTGNAKTRKRALSPLELRQLHDYRPTDKDERFAIDMFFLSFYTRGMALVDIAKLKRENMTPTTIAYKRSKTGQRLVIRRTPQANMILRRNPSANLVYVLPIIRSINGHERNQFRYRQLRINKALKRVGQKLGIDNLTLYMARHSWASVARMMNVPVEVISKCMGHDSEKTTQIYLKDFDNDSLHEANDKVIGFIVGAN